MTGRQLDVTTLPFDQAYTCKDGSKIDMCELLDQHYEAVQALAATGLIKANDSFGFAMLAPVTEDNIDMMDVEEFWDKPEQFVWFVGGWGSKRDVYIANAVRKLRAIIRCQQYNQVDALSTLDLHMMEPAFFRDTVDDQNEDGTYPWGDFPWGGAVVMPYGDDLGLAAAVSCLTEIEDDTVARLIIGNIAKKIILGDGMLSND